jgi:glycosyltransferase involved in cell wall biosynthesis
MGRVEGGEEIAIADTSRPPSDNVEFKLHGDPVHRTDTLRGDAAPQVDLVSVVIPTLNSSGTLAICLKSIVLQEECSIEIIVVDGGSTDGTQEIAGGFGARIVVGDYGRSSARRVGAEIATGRFLFFVDSDQSAGPGLLSECVRMMNADEDIAALRVPERVPGEGIWNRCFRADQELLSHEDLAYPRFFRRRCYEVIGGHHSRLESFMEDRLIFLRLRQQGWRIAWTKSVLIHPVGMVNPLEIGIRGARSALDSQTYYQLIGSSGADLEKVLSLKARALLHNLSGSNVTLGVLVALPLFGLVAHGPRLVTALMGLSRARRA